MEFEEGLLKRFKDLEASQDKLREQLGVVLGEDFILTTQTNKTKLNSNDISKKIDDDDECDTVILPGYFRRNPYQSVLQHIGHAIYVFRPGAGDIIFWNQSAEHLYGWKEYEALGQTIVPFLIDQENDAYFKNILKKLSLGQTWSGQFPCRKRSGHVFTALITVSPLYENTELIGIIIVSSDSAILNDMNNENSNAYWNGYTTNQQKESMRNFEGRNSQSDIASSVYNLASKKLHSIHAYNNKEGDNRHDIFGSLCSKNSGVLSASITIFRLRSGYGGEYNYVESLKYNHHSNYATKLLSKLTVRGNSADFQETVNSSQTNTEAKSSPIVPDNFASCNGNRNQTSNNLKIGPENRKNYNSGSSNGQCSERGSTLKSRNGFSSKKKSRNISRDQNRKSGEEQVIENSQVALWKERRLKKQHENSGTSVSVNNAKTDSCKDSILSYVEKSNMDFVCDIHWEDILMGEEVGQGSYAVVYRGVWNGSDVAIKVYLGNDYQEGHLLDYKKEIAIMKGLRHPNVLLFMGAVYSPERLAIVTEYLPRGSLYRTLHRNGQKLDLKRRLMMALDVARGMNYLHRRNPPIIHRDLKSSNLLVDKNWTVKVGDFGLSCFKISTLLTATSGRGTPQWMAPEVLRGECTNEKSDVFSFGVILWELMTESIPWADLNPLQVIGVVGFMDRRLDLPDKMDPRVSSIIRDCWNSDPSNRPSFEELVGRTSNLICEVSPTAPRKKTIRKISAMETIAT